MRRIVTVIVGLLAPAAALAQGSRAASFTFEQVRSYPYPTDLTAAATGTRVAWAFNEQGRRNIYVAEGPTFAARQLTHYDRDDGQELSSVAVAFFAVVLIAQMRALARGPEAYARFLARLGSPLVLSVSLVAFLFVVFHAVTWFNLAPTAMVVRVRGKRVPDAVISGSNYAAWMVLSAAVAFLMLRG